MSCLCYPKVQEGHELLLYLYIVSNDEPSIGSRKQITRDVYVYVFLISVIIPRSTDCLSVLPSVPRYFSLYFSQQLLMAEI